MRIIRDSSAVVQRARARAMKYNYYGCMRMLCVREGRRDQMMLWRVGYIWDQGVGWCCGGTG